MSFHDRNLLGRTLGHAYKTGRAKGYAQAIEGANAAAEEVILAVMYEAGLTELELSDETLEEVCERFSLDHVRDAASRTTTFELVEVEES